MNSRVDYNKIDGEKAIHVSSRVLNVSRLEKIKKNCHVKYFKPYRCYYLAHDLILFESFFERGLVKVYFFEKENRRVQT